MENLKDILSRNDFNFKKQFGQNFLTDENLLSSIVSDAGVTENDTVLEIGAGAGALTCHLAKKAKRVISYEIDKKLMPILDETLAPYKNVDVVFKDFMSLPLSEIEKSIGEPYKVVANLPYYITTPLIMRLLEEGKMVESITCMVQEEVADRFCAKENTAEYGSITASINFIGSARKTRFVPRTLFTPRPNVDSAIVRIDVQRGKYDLNYKAFDKVKRSAFLNRRKMLVGNIMKDYSLSREVVEKVFDSVGIDKKVRGEVLTAEQFVMLAKELEKVIN